MKGEMKYEEKNFCSSSSIGDGVGSVYRMRKPRGYRARRGPGSGAGRCGSE